ncbi:flavoprotein [Cytobacillus oceanisediminis]|uniref:flavoprotein n=1 Tax=Cytobacillus oceanisediminis TaxID=665099 RepID=UPI00215ADA11|nr:flavoprotein [Cytobacillus oceanisediminis]
MVENTFIAFLDRYLDIWRNCSLAEMKRVVARDFQAREVTDGLVSDFGFEESITGWEKGFKFIKENEAQWDVSKVSILQLREGEMLAILSATIIINGISLDTANLFFQTFKEDTLGEWKLARSYIEAGIPSENIKSLALK